MDIPELFKAWIGGTLRHLLGGFFAAAAAKGYVTGEQAEMTMLWLIGFLAMLAWSLIQKARAKAATDSRISGLLNAATNVGRGTVSNFGND